ncbi:CRISPR-associated protein Cas6/Cse3/CasE [Chitinispirillum alkaliphilum]|nr:CRISPR-associated protein Cas6/Cse3/CasE [Chitinispirillum alkaliphilum]
MYLSRVQIKPGPEMFSIIKRDTASNSYAVHQLLWSLFPNDGEKKRDFIYREDSEGGLPRFYLVSGEMPLSNNAALVDSKQYNPSLVKGEQLHFTLVANPVVARITKGKKHSVKHDVWMDAKKKAEQDGKKGPETVAECECAVKNWLINRSEANGFHIDINQICVDGYLQHRFKQAKGGREIRFSSIKYEGLLTVNDPELFVKCALYRGVGPAKAFGCGLMLVKRKGR